MYKLKTYTLRAAASVLILALTFDDDQGQCVAVWSPMLFLHNVLFLKLVIVKGNPPSFLVKIHTQSNK